jgi:hypothetical protein
VQKDLPFGVIDQRTPSQASSYIAAYQRQTDVYRSYTDNLADQ